MTHVKIGVTLPQFTSDADAFVDGARRAEDLGLDSVWVFDHLWPLGGSRQHPVLECWTALAWLAAATSRIGIGTLVTRSSLRNPALLASMAATVARVAPGRVTVGLGSGDDKSRDENEAFGIPYLAGEARLRQLRSTLEVLMQARAGRQVDVSDDTVTVRGLPAASPADLRLWVGGWGPRVVRLAAERADGWNAWGGGAARFEAAVLALRAAARGRAVEATWGGTLVLGTDENDARAKLGRRDPTAYVVGGPEQVAAELRTLAAAGAGHLIVSFHDARDPSALELLASEVVPRVRQPDMYPPGV